MEFVVFLSTRRHSIRYFIVVVCVGASMLLEGSRSALAVSGPAVTVNPATGLRDHELLTLRGTGFEPNALIQVIQCAGTPAKPPLSSKDCDGNTLNPASYADAH